MTQRIYKIIVAVSMMLGVLGPQVATGQEMNVQPALYRAEYNEPSIPVVVSPDSEKNIVVESSRNGICSSQGDSRFDLLLWQSCDLILSLGQSPQIEIVAVTNNNPDVKVVVKTEPSISIPPSLTALPSGQTEAVLSNYVQSSLLDNELKAVQQLSLKQDSEITQLSFVNIHQSMVMRC